MHILYSQDALSLCCKKPYGGIEDVGWAIVPRAYIVVWLPFVFYRPYYFILSTSILSLQ